MRVYRGAQPVVVATAPKTVKQVGADAGPRPVLAFTVSGGSKINSGFAAWEHGLKDDVEAAARKIAWKIREALSYERN